MKIKRLIHDLIGDAEISNKMLLLAGPRQTGKTTVAKDWLHASNNDTLYFNWDDEKIRRAFRRDPHFFESAVREAGTNSRVVFDEIHKIPNWKTLLKGYYDVFGSDFNFLITGSARLEYFHRHGDSMLGRYHLLHLSPLIPNEIENRWKQPNFELIINHDVLASESLRQDTIDSLITFSGFPEPFLKQSERSLNLWHMEYQHRVVREDLRDMTRINDFNRIEHVLELLPKRVGSPFSLNALREDIGCSYDAARAVIKALDKLYVLAPLRPYSKNVKYSISKEPKIYLTDWTMISDEGPRFENFMAIQLNAFCDYVTDGGWCKMELFYIRDKQKHETDFILVKDNVPKLLIETKVGNEGLDPSLKLFSKALKDIAAIQVVKKPKVFSIKGKNMIIVSANRFFNLLWN